MSQEQRCKVRACHKLKPWADTKTCGRCGKSVCHGHARGWWTEGAVECRSCTKEVGKDPKFETKSTKRLRSVLPPSLSFGVDQDLGST
jgi:hypothetical protein